MWRPGEAIARREIVRGRPRLGSMVIVVADERGPLATYLPGGALESAECRYVV